MTKQNKDKMKIYVMAKCIGCGYKKKIYAGEIPQGEQPMCNKCFNIMIAESAETEK